MIAHEAADLACAVGSTRADVVIAGPDPSGSGEGFDTLLERYPRLKVFAVSRGGKATAFHEMRPHRVPLGELSPAGLLTAIRQALNPGSGTPVQGGPIGQP